MEQIKVRIWDKKDKRMIYLKDNLHLSYGDDAGYFLSIGQAEHSDFYDEAIEDFIPMLFTGLRDKDGKEIYEGDIFQFGTKKEWEKGDGERGFVQWHDKLARFGLDFYSIYSMEGYTGKNQHLIDLIRGLKIIGNIYENSGLLKIKG